MPQQTSPTQDRVTGFRNRITQCKTVRSQLVPEWQKNIEYRRGKTTFDTNNTASTFSVESANSARSGVTLDWSNTKRKQAQLFSQVPQVQLTPKHAEFNAAVPVFSKLLNDTLTWARVGVAMDEVLPDVINAAGIGGVIVGYEALTEQIEVPTIDPATLLPEQQMAYQQGLLKLPTKPVTRITDKRFSVTRISPSDLLWPVEFAGSDFDDAPWVGRSGRMTTVEAKKAFKLTDEQIEKAAGESRTNTQDRLVPNAMTSQGVSADADAITFDEIFYKRHLYHNEEKSFDAIHRMVFIGGIEEPVIDEPWKGQSYDPQSRAYVGACKFPIRVLTITHLSDETVPPSDSEISRPQVDELKESRVDRQQQRRNSIPIRWFDTNRVDVEVQDNLQRGIWQGMIPTNGPGDKVIGEVARASHPREDFEFDRMAKQELSEAWSIGANQLGSFASGERSATEAGIVQSNFQTQVGYERAKVGSFFVGIAEVMAGLLSLYGDFELPNVDQEGQQRLQSWNRQALNGKFVYSIWADSTVLLDANQRIQRLEHFINYAAKSPMADVTDALAEWAMLAGLDPAKVIKQPQAPGPEQPNISYRFSGAADLMNPVTLAILMKAGQAPSPEELTAAKTLLASLNTPSAMPPVAPPMPGVEGAAPAPSTPPVNTDEWDMADRINKRMQ